MSRDVDLGEAAQELDGRHDFGARERDIHEAHVAGRARVRSYGTGVLCYKNIQKYTVYVVSLETPGRGLFYLCTWH